MNDGDFVNLVNEGLTHARSSAVFVNVWLAGDTFEGRTRDGYFCGSISR